MSSKKKILYLLYLFLLFILIFPYIYLGDSALIIAHDYLDNNVPLLKMIRDNGLFLAFDEPVPALDGLSTLYISWIGFTFQTFIYALFEIYWAHVIIVVFSVVFAFISTKLFLNMLLPEYCENYIIIAVSLVFSILPNFYGYSIAVSVIPISFCLFYWFATRDAHMHSINVLLLFIYPFFSFFAYVGIFVLGLWFLGTIYVSIKCRTLHRQLYTGLIVLILGYIVVDARLFYMQLIMQEPTNRDIFLSYAVSNGFTFAEDLKTFWLRFIDLLLNGSEYGESLHKVIILPLVTFTLIFSVIQFFGKTFSITRINFLYSQYFKSPNNLFKFLLFCAAILFFIFFAVMSRTIMFRLLLETICPALAGFQFSRLFLFARFLWYVALALALCIWVYEFNWIKIIGKYNKTIFQPKVLLTVALSIVLMQGLYIVKKKTAYHVFSRYSYKMVLSKFFNVYNRVEYKHNIPPNSGFFYSSIQNYYAEQLFKKIKNDINYSNEKVASFRLDPAIAIYNGFYTVDGYYSTYPLKYMLKFRTLIAPELEVNHARRDHYDSWGGTLYLFNDDSGKNGYTLRINPQVMRNDFDIRYIISAVEIKNSIELGIRLYKHYSDSSSDYSIYLYQVDNV